MLIRSAALRKTAARSAKGRDSHSDLAARADSMALLTSSALAREYRATTDLWSAGFTWVPIEEVLI